MSQPSPADAIPLEVRRRWMMLLVDAVAKAGSLNVSFIDIFIAEGKVYAHQVKRAQKVDSIEFVKMID